MLGDEGFRYMSTYLMYYINKSFTLSRLFVNQGRFSFLYIVHNGSHGFGDLFTLHALEYHDYL